jgi:hypothetical protein
MIISPGERRATVAVFLAHPPVTTSFAIAVVLRMAFTLHPAHVLFMFLAFFTAQVAVHFVSGDR